MRLIEENSHHFHCNAIYSFFSRHGCAVTVGCSPVSKWMPQADTGYHLLLRVTLLLWDSLPWFSQLAPSSACFCHPVLRLQGQTHIFMWIPWIQTYVSTLAQPTIPKGDINLRHLINFWLSITLPTNILYMHAIKDLRLWRAHCVYNR